MSYNFLKPVIVLICTMSTISSDICDHNYVDNMYTKSIYATNRDGVDRSYSLIAIVRGDEEFVWNLETKSVGHPIKVNETKKVLTEVSITSLPDCDYNTSESECLNFDKLVDKAITFFYNSVEHKYSYEYSFMEYIRHYPSPVQPRDLPNDTAISGDPTEESDENLWPNGWVTQSNPCVAFDDYHNEIVYIMNSDNTNVNTRIVRNLLNYTNWSQLTEQTLSTSTKFVGFFNLLEDVKENELAKILAISIDETKNSKVFEFTRDREFKDTEMDFRQLMGCEAKSKPNGFTFIIILIIILVIIVFLCSCGFLVVKTVVIPQYRSSKGSKPSVTVRTEDSQSEADQTVVTIDSTTGKPVEKPEQKPFQSIH